MNERHDGSDLKFVTRMPGAFRMGVLILGLLTTFAVVAPVSSKAPTVMSLLLVILLTALFTAVFFMQTVVRIGPHEVHIRVAGIFATTIPYDQIVGVALDRGYGSSGRDGIAHAAE